MATFAGRRNSMATRTPKDKNTRNPVGRKVPVVSAATTKRREFKPLAEKVSLTPRPVPSPGKTTRNVIVQAFKKGPDVNALLKKGATTKKRGTWPGQGRCGMYQASWSYVAAGNGEPSPKRECENLVPCPFPGAGGPSASRRDSVAKIRPASGLDMAIQRERSRPGSG